MNRSPVIAFGCLLIGLNPPSYLVAADADDALRAAQSQIDLIFDLRDRTHLIARLPSDSLIPIHAGFGRVEIPVELVDSI